MKNYIILGVILIIYLLCSKYVNIKEGLVGIGTIANCKTQDGETCTTCNTGFTWQAPPATSDSCLPGLDILTPGPVATAVATKEACQSLCKADDSCNWWSYYPTTLTQSEISAAADDGLQYDPGGCYTSTTENIFSTDSPVSIGGSKNCNFPVLGKCVANIPNCEIQTGATCTTCNDGYTLNGDGKCIAGVAGVNPITTDLPIIISNQNMGGRVWSLNTNAELTPAQSGTQSFIFRNVPGSGSSNKPLSYTDVVIVQWKNPSGRDVDTPNGDTENCGWYGCRVLQPPNAQDSSKVPTFDHGGSSPAKVMLMAPPSLVKAGNYNGPIHDGDPVCFQWAGSPTNWGFTGNCGWMGCRILTDYLGKPPAGTTGEYGWDHGGGKDEPGGGPIGYPNGPTVFNLRIAPPPHKPSPMDACDIWSEGCGVMPIKACVSPDPAVKGVGGAECNIDSACLADPNCKGVWRSGNGCSKMTCTNTQPAFGHCVRIPQKPSQFAGKFVYVKDKYDFNASKTSDGDSVYYVQWPNVIRYVPGDGKGGFAGTAQNCHANYETWKRSISTSIYSV